MRSPALSLASLGFAAFALVAAPRAAHAGDFAVGADGGVLVPTDGNISTGFDLGGRFGYRAHLGPLWLQPEIQGGYMKLGSAGLGRATGGARFGLGGLLQPQVFAHAGAAFGDANGFSFDAGGALDVKLSIFFAGVHGAVGYLDAGKLSGTVTWIDIGPHAGFLL
ncbi:MAG TPA: hypothetical protein VHB21_10290 [Minicystis sp.]|nr:hypothetical protein [Minicystis sp.]